MVEIHIGGQRIVLGMRRPDNEGSGDEDDTGPPCHVQ